VLALFASLFLGVLIAIGRDVTRVSGPREISRLTGLPLLARLPAVSSPPLQRRPRKFNPEEREVFDTLERMVTLALPQRRQHVILVTSALAGEGRTRVVAGLGRALARNGRDVLLLSADLRRPRLHQYFSVLGDFGVADVLGENLENGKRPSSGDIVPALLGPLPQASGNLMLLASGKPSADPARLFSDDLLEPFFDAIGMMHFEYVVIDAPPLLGRVDTYALARRSTGILVVARPDRLRADNAAELRELLDRLETDPLGLVVVGR
jgi:Mrp family chromosome partitioning ATPase